MNSALGWTCQYCKCFIPAGGLHVCVANGGWTCSFCGTFTPSGMSHTCAPGVSISGWTCGICNAYVLSGQVHTCRPATVSLPGVETRLPCTQCKSSQPISIVASYIRDDIGALWLMQTWCCAICGTIINTVASKVEYPSITFSTGSNSV